MLAAATAPAHVTQVIERWIARLRPRGGIWVLTPKRGLPGYLDQREVIRAGLPTGLVDNKSCSVSDETSAIRFVIRRKDRRTPA